MKAVILNYLDGSVCVAELPEHIFDGNASYLTENIENYLCDTLGFYLDEIAYMTSDGYIPVYPCGQDSPAPIAIL